jgi:hypothetical protein
MVATAVCIVVCLVSVFIGGWFRFTKVNNKTSSLRKLVINMWTRLWLVYLAMSLSSVFIVLSAFSYFNIMNSILFVTSIWIVTMIHMIRIPQVVVSTTSTISPDEGTEQAYLLSSKGSDTATTTPQVSQEMQSIITELQSYPKSIFEALRHRPVAVAGIIFACAFFSSVFIFSTCNLCLADHPISVSSSASRLAMDIRPYFCFWNAVCFMYFTVPRDMSTSMLVNFQIRSYEPEETLVFYTDQNNETLSTNATCFYMEHNPDYHRYQCWADLLNLSPNTVYTVSLRIMAPDIEGELHKLTSQTRSFKTGPPITSDEDIVFVEGGDVQWNTAGIALAKAAAELSPHFAIVAGDIFYANGMHSCYGRIDEWIYNWDMYMRTNKNHSIPILTSIGNHEAGGFDKSRNKVAFYFRMFPHATGLHYIEPNNRLPYHDHIFSGHTYLVILDTYVVAPIQGAQLDWLTNTLQLQLPSDNIYNNRIAAYHASAYPIDPSEIPEITKELKTYFTPLFDQYNFKAVFENHYHVYAQTKVIRNGKVVTDGSVGTIYFGQGAWGVLYTYPSNFKVPEYIERYEAICNLFAVTCSATNCQVKTIVYDSKNNKIISRSPINI